ncbi:MAG: ATP-binding cassette domain-containing protein [Acidimicrobiales bacterium]
MSSSGILFYLFTIFAYAGVDMLACLGLSQQFGIAGVTNFGFIIFQSAGAYAAGILSLQNQSSNGGFQTYILGWHLPFPLPWIGAALAGALLSIPFRFLVGKRLRGDFAAVGLLVTAVMLNLLVTNYRPFLNGAAGLSLVPSPLQGEFNPQGFSYQAIYSIGSVVIAVLAYFFLRRITESPYGRSLRAMRDNDLVADSIGKNLMQMRTSMLVLGGAIAGLSGGVLVGFINLWAPSAWSYAETIVLFAAVIIGGVGNHKGAILGAILVPLGFEEITRFLPSVGNPELIPALQWVAIGLLITLFLWFRPRGVIPEKRRIIAGVVPPVVTKAENDDEVDSVIQLLPRSSALDERPLLLEGSSIPILEARNLVKSFGGVNAVRDVNLSILPGRLTGLIGPNGAGKSTTLAMLAGTLTPTSGTILYKGEDITSLPTYLRARKGLVRTFQLASEFKALTVIENLLVARPNQVGDSFVGALRGKRYWGPQDKEAIEEAKELIARFGLTAHSDTYAGDLSGGQRRLVEIMRAIMAKPEVLLLDEPMAGVHPRLAHQIGNHLLSLCATGVTIVMVEHELAIMDEFCDPVVVMADGSVLAEGTMQSLRGRPEVVEAYLVG